MTFVGIQTFHTHTTETNAPTHCQICKIAHQVPALINPPAVTPFSLSVQQAVSITIPHPYLRFVFQSHGLAPPVL